MIGGIVIDWGDLRMIHVLLVPAQVPGAGVGV